MKLGRVEVLLIILLIVGCAWMASQYLPGGIGPRSCAPVPLSPEVKAYIDNKIATGAGAQCGEIPKVVGRVAELETRMGDLDKFRQMREQIEDKRQQLEQALSQQRRDQAELLSNIRNSEITRLRNEVATMCAGITVKSASDKDGEPDYAAPLEGMKGGGAAPGAGGQPGMGAAENPGAGGGYGRPGARRRRLGNGQGGGFGGRQGGAGYNGGAGGAGNGQNN